MTYSALPNSGIPLHALPLQNLHALPGPSSSYDFPPFYIPAPFSFLLLTPQTSPNSCPSQTRSLYFPLLTAPVPIPVLAPITSASPVLLPPVAVTLGAGGSGPGSGAGRAGRGRRGAV